MCGRNRGGWARGWLRECCDRSQLWAEPLGKELCSAAPEGSPRPAQRPGCRERNGRLWPRQAPGCSRGQKVGSRLSCQPLGEPPVWLQLPTTQDRGDPRWEVFHPESKLLGGATGRVGGPGWAEPLATSPSPAGILLVVTGGAHTQPAAGDTLLNACSAVSRGEARCHALQLCHMY